MLALLFVATGGLSLWMLREAEKSFTKETQRAEAVESACLKLRSAISAVNGEYVPPLAGPPAGSLNRHTYDLKQPEITQYLRQLNTQPSRAETSNEAVEALEKALGSYYATYESYFADHPADQEMRRELFRRLSLHSQKVIFLTETIITAAQEKRTNGVAALNSQLRRNQALIGTVVLLGLAVIYIAYLYLARRLADPVAQLNQSIEASKAGNFELSLPPVAVNGEWSALTHAFNEMAAELNMRRRESDETLRRVHQLNRSLLMGIPAPVYVIDPSRSVLQLNPAAEHFNDQLGVDRRLPHKLQRLFDEVAETGRDWMPEDVREAVLFRINEQEFFYLPRIFTLYHENQDLAGWAVVIHDVSRIRFLDDIKTNLLSTVSHEIKTPLTGIRMALHMMVEESNNSGLTPLQCTMLQTATGDCERLLSTLNKLLELARVESGATHLDLQPTDLMALIRQTAATFQASSDMQDVRLQIESTGDYPLVRGDALRLGEVFNNLVSNALKHSPPGGIVTLRLTQPDAQHLRLTVIDQGAGVPEAYQQKIFERFFRAPGQHGDGMGLGLFVCREIIRAHEGRIGLHDRKADQTEFFIDLPLA